MKNTRTHNKTMKKKLLKCKTVFTAHNELQYKYGDILDQRIDILEIKCNVPFENCEYDYYTSDFYCIKTNGEVMVRECLFQSKLSKPSICKLLDFSRNYWESKGVSDWGIVLDANK